MRQASAPTNADLDLLCFIDTFSDIAPGARLHELLTRAQRTARVLVVTQPTRRSGPPRMECIETTEGLQLAMPQLSGGPAYLVKGTVRRLVDQAVRSAELGPYAIWCNTPMANAFIGGLTPSLVIYDRAGRSRSTDGSPERAAREHELLQRAELVLVGSDAELGATGGHPGARVLPDGSSAADWDARWSQVRAWMEGFLAPRLAPAA